MKEHFEKFLGMGNATEAPLDLQAYSYDASETEGKARIVLFPSQDEQLRLILTYCNRTNLDVVIRGNGTGVVGGAVPNNSVVVCTQGFDRIHSINIKERWVKVDCGVTIKELNEALAKHEVMYPLEPFSPLTTVGAFLSENGTSRHGLAYGRAIHSVREIELMDGTGKNVVTSRDLEDYIGSEGTVCIILRAKLKIIPLVERSADILHFDTVGQAVQKAFEILDSERKPIALEYLDVAVSTYLGINTKHTLIVEYEDDKGALRHEDYKRIIRRRESVRRKIGEQGFILMDDSLVPLDNLESSLRWCAEHNAPTVAHLGQGIIHPFFKRENEGDRAKWQSYLVTNGAEVNGQSGIGRLKKAYAPIGNKTKWRQLKEKTDYNGIMGRGKLYDFV